MGFMSINRDLVEGQRSLDAVEDQNQLVEIVKYNMQNAASQRRATWAASNRIDDIIEKVNKMCTKMDTNANKVQQSAGRTERARHQGGKSAHQNG